jgi:hypothetical protein
VQFEITEQTRSALAAWIKLSGLRSDDIFSQAVSVLRPISAPGKPE